MADKAIKFLLSKTNFLVNLNGYETYRNEQLFDGIMPNFHIVGNQWDNNSPSSGIY